MTENRTKARGRTSDRIVVYDRDSGKLIGSVYDLTAEGTMLVSHEPFAINEKTVCRMILPDIIEGCREVHFMMESRWSRMNRTTGWYETGFQFINLSELGIRILEHLVSEWVTSTGGDQSRQPTS